MSLNHAAAPDQVSSVTTSGTGSFVFEGLAPGVYLVNIKQANYPQTMRGGVTKSVIVKASEQTSVTVELMPGASVTGHILDEDGDPMDGCRVQAGTAAHPDGEFATERLEQGAPGKSEYRLYGIMPGKYYLVARCQANVFEPRPLSSGPDPPPSHAYPKVYYPSSTTPESAQLLDLAPGEERSGMDFRMKPAPVTRIHATLAGGADWRGRKDMQWQLIRTDQTEFGSWQSIDTAKGFFDIPSVFGGSYTLVVTSNSVFGDHRVPGGASDAPIIGARQRIDVPAEATRPVEVAIQLRQGVDVAGTVEIEGANTGNPLKLSQINVQLNTEFGGGATPTTVAEDGAFLVRYVFPGDLRLQVNAPMGFLKRAWLGGVEVTDGRIDLSSGARGNLKIFVSANTATVRGTAPPGALVEVEFGDRDGSGNIQTQADQNGQFTIPGLAPGKYHIGIDDGGRDITVHEGETLVVGDLTER